MLNFPRKEERKSERKKGEKKGKKEEKKERKGEKKGEKGEGQNGVVYWERRRKCVKSNEGA